MNALNAAKPVRHNLGGREAPGHDAHPVETVEHREEGAYQAHRLLVGLRRLLQLGREALKALIFDHHPRRESQQVGFGNRLTPLVHLLTRVDGLGALVHDKFTPKVALGTPQMRQSQSHGLTAPASSGGR